jgi:hypothetical protein
VLRFRSGANATLFSLAYEIAGRDLKPNIDTQHKRFDLQVCFFSLIRNEQGEVVGTVSQKAPFSGPLADLESFTRDTIVETQPFILPPGRYTVESAVVSIEQNAASTARTSLLVPRRAALDLSDLVLVNGVEKTSQDNSRRFDPLESELGQIKPELNPLIAVHPGMKLALYFQVYASAGAQPRIEMELKRDGIATGTLAPKPLPVPAPGVLPYFTPLDVGQLSPGSYVVEVTARQGSGMAHQSLAFEVASRTLPEAARN